MFQHSFSESPCSIKIHNGVTAPVIREHDLDLPPDHNFSETLAMGLFDLFKKTEPIEDSVFGRMTWKSSGCWNSNISFYDQNPIISVAGTKAGLDPNAHAFFKELEERYPEIKKEITADLFELYSNYREDVDPDKEPDFPNYQSAEDMHDTSLQTISILHSHTSDFSLILGYSMGWHEDHEFEFPISDWEVEGVIING